ncbi:ATP-binding protein [Streptomyces sp. NPDC046977]|uniref:ATP-binding protein n=1 Tax=Streptomyces sp. NPDC046977 TaxID=3154703 RepID=UPI0033D4FE0B
MIVAVPLVVASVLAAPLAEQRLRVIRQAGQTASLMHVAGPMGALVEQLQREQLLAVAHLAAPAASGGTLLAGMNTVDITLEHVRSLVDDVPKARETLTNMEQLQDLRSEVLADSVGPLEASRGYDRFVVALLDSLELWHPRGDSGTDAERQTSLEALLRSDISGNSADAALLASLVRSPEKQAAEVVTQQQALQSLWAQRFQHVAEPGYAQLARVNSGGSIAMRALEYSTQVRREVMAPSLSPEARARLLEEAANTFLIQAELRLLVQHTIARDAEQAANAKAHEAMLDTVTYGGALVLVLVALLFLSITVGRSVSLPLRTLTEAAARAADAAERELQRIDDDVMAEPLDAGPLKVAMKRSDEIGQLSEAVDRVQSGALDLVRRQQMSQRNVAAMFASVGRRSHNLVSRQLSMIDDLEREETDRALLENLYRLDHLTNRLRRTAANIVVLSGTTERFGFGKPVPVAHAMRSALAEVEDFQRVVLTSVVDLHLASEVGQPLISIMAELLENALSFSPPDTVVELSAAHVSGGCLIAIRDNGVGMSEQRLVEENARIRSRERLDLAPTDTLGLFVVGRLARQTDADVSLSAGEDGGVTAWITVPRRHLVPPPGGSGSNARAAHESSPKEVQAYALDVAEAPSGVLGGRQGGLQAALPRVQGIGPHTRQVSGQHTESGLDTATTTSPALFATSPQADLLHAFLGDLHDALSELGEISPWPAFGSVDAGADGTRSRAQPRGSRTGAEQSAGPPPGGEGLVRRVPGANLATDLQPSGAVQAHPRHDPDASRALIDDIQYGVARAHAAHLQRPTTF